MSSSPASAAHWRKRTTAQQPSRTVHPAHTHNEKEREEKRVCAKKASEREREKERQRLEREQQYLGEEDHFREFDIFFVESGVNASLTIAVKCFLTNGVLIIRSAAAPSNQYSVEYDIWIRESSWMVPTLQIIGDVLLYPCVPISLGGFEEFFTAHASSERHCHREREREEK
jgi:hypothetical protein